MLSQHEKNSLIREILATAEIIGSRKMSDNAVLMIINDLNQNGLNDYKILLQVFSKIRKTENGNLTLKTIIDYYNSEKQNDKILLLEQKETEREMEERKIYNKKCWSIINLMQNNTDFCKLMNEEHAKNETFQEKARRILNENKELKSEAVAFFKQAKQKSNKEYLKGVVDYV